ncbi:hypothetical protein JB92DRAFT_2830434 [Gautieria morchelliformis]|nr:hypothetical protein JB92DRAFT_2830434 [Gautieria morchelliformis]
MAGKKKKKTKDEGRQQGAGYRRWFHLQTTRCQRHPSLYCPDIHLCLQRAVKSSDPATRKTGAADAIVGSLVLSTIPKEDHQQEGDKEDKWDREPGLGLVSEDDLGCADVFGDSEREEDEEEEVADLSEDFESPSSDDNPDSDVKLLTSPVEPPKKKGKAAAKEQAVVSMPDSLLRSRVTTTHLYVWSTLWPALFDGHRSPLVANSQVGLENPVRDLRGGPPVNANNCTNTTQASVVPIPEEKRAGLVTHFYKDPAKRCFTLETEDDWITLKDEWASQVAKRGCEAAIEIVLIPKAIFPVFRGSGQGSDRHRK